MTPRTADKMALAEGKAMRDAEKKRRAERIQKLLDDGMTPTEVSRSLGLSKNAVGMAISRRKKAMEEAR